MEMEKQERRVMRERDEWIGVPCAGLLHCSDVSDTDTVRGSGRQGKRGSLDRKLSRSREPGQVLERQGQQVDQTTHRQFDWCMAAAFTILATLYNSAQLKYWCWHMLPPPAKEVMFLSTFVSLLAGLRENYSTDFHKTRWKGDISAFIFW